MFKDYLFESVKFKDYNYIPQIEKRDVNSVSSELTPKCITNIIQKEKKHPNNSYLYTDVESDTTVIAIKHKQVVY